MRRTLGLAVAGLSAGVFVFFALGLFSPVAHSVPAFARKTGLACSACHEVWPRLNDFGQLYRDRGYRLERGKDAPVAQDPSYWPLAMRSTVGYQWLRNALVRTDTGPVTTENGTFGFSGLDVFAAGTLAENISVLIVYTPSLSMAGFGTGPAPGGLESAFVGVHDILGSPWLNLRVGKHALDQPIDEHRTLTLTQGYNLYHYRLPESRAGFEVSNQAGLELSGHSGTGRLRYSLSLVNNEGAPLSKGLVSAPALWGHVQGTHYLDNDFLAAFRVGAFGAAGWSPTSSASITPPGGVPEAVPGTAADLRSFYRAGAELHLVLLSTVRPLTLSGVILWGTDDRDLTLGASGRSHFMGGVVEAVWTPSIRWSVIARYERVRNTQVGIDDAFQDTGNITAVTGALRHTFELTSRTEVAAHLEASRSTIRANPTEAPSTVTLLAALDFAF